ncbi:hypothetical protein TcG_09375 [Trypanosoma cruzi]|nr:hypothetical protein TcG_09375 [Trypanosoma cruzi]
MTFTPNKDAWTTLLNSAVKINGSARFVLGFLDGEIPRHFPQQQLASTVTHIHNTKHRQIADDGADPSPPRHGHVALLKDAWFAVPVHVFQKTEASTTAAQGLHGDSFSKRHLLNPMQSRNIVGCRHLKSIQRRHIRVTPLEHYRKNIFIKEQGI